MAQIDSLEIQITADAKKAVSSLQTLSNSLTNISRALSSVNTSGFDGITNGINGITMAMRDYASSGVKTADFTRLATQLNKVGSINAVGIDYISRALGKLGQNMASLQTVGSQISNVVELSKALSRLGSESIQKAIDNMPRLTKALNDMLKSLSQAPKVSKNLTELLKAIGGISGRMGSLSLSTNNASKSLDLFHRKATKSTSASKGLASAIGKVYATYWMLFRAFGVLKKAVDYASDLTEVQNVVEQTFGQSTQRVNEFAKASKDSLGMSELTAKEIASRYQAMGGAMNIASSSFARVNKELKDTTNGYIEAGNSASSMSLTLTKLAGDMASFYNKEQKDVAQDLEAIYTGMTRPLRKYGIDLSQATLKEYASAKGIDKKVSAMTQAEKTMLRYQMVLERTTTAQGDFVRTADTWANQVKIMKQNFISLGTTIGQVFINAFKPWVRTLNAVLVKVNDFAIKVANALGNIFGWTYEGNDVGLLSEFEDDANSLADDFGDANKEAKKLKNTIMGYDELNVMKKPKDDDGSGGGAGNGLNGLDNGASKMGHWVKKYESDIGNLFDLGRKISDTLTKMFQSINWNEIYKNIGDKFRGIAEFLNGLITPELFGEVGKALASSLNSAFHGLYEFAKEFDWKNLGESIASGINNFFERANFDSWVQTLLTWVNGICNTIQEVVKDVHWEDIAKKVATAISNVFDEDTFKNVANTIAQLLNTALKTALSLGENIKWDEIGEACASGVNEFFDKFDWGTFAETINTWVQGVFNALKTAIGGDEKTGKKGIDWSKVWDGVKEFLSHLDIETVEIVIGAFALMHLKKQITPMLIKKLLLASIGTLYKKIGLGEVLLTFKLKLLNIGKSVAVLLWDLVKAGFVAFKNDIKGAFNKSWVEGTDGALNELRGVGSNTVWTMAITETLLGSIEKANKEHAISKAFADLLGGGSKENFDKSMENINKRYASGEYKSIPMYWEHLKEMIGLTKKETEGLQGKVKPIEVEIQQADGSWKQLNSSVEKTYVPLNKAYGEALKMSGTFGTISKEADNTKNKATELGNGFKGAFANAKTELDSLSTSVGNKLGGTFEKATTSLHTWADETKTKSAGVKTSFDTFTQNVSGKLSTTYDSAMTSIKAWADDTEVKRQATKDLFNRWSDDLKKDIARSFTDMAKTMSDWWLKDAQPLFDMSKWRKATDNISNALSQSVGEAFIKFQSLSETWWRGTVEPMFSTQRWSFSGIKDGLERAFENAIDGIKQIWNKFANWMNDKLEISWEGQSIMGQEIFPSGSFRLGKLPTFATGGFPEDGLFMANHGELVGKFSNGRTAVANNEQITEGIRQAVVDGMMQVVMATSGNNNASGNEPIQLVLDGRIIAQSTYNNLKTMGRQGVIPRFV